MRIAGYCNLRLCGEFQRYSSCVPVKRCFVIMRLFFTFHMGGKISIRCGVAGSVIMFARLWLALEFTGERNRFLFLFGRLRRGGRSSRGDWYFRFFVKWAVKKCLRLAAQ